MLNRLQFEQLAKKANEQEGFSVKVAGEREGREAADAYMVGGYAPSQSHDAPVTGAQIETYAGEQHETLAQPEVYLGAWHDKKREPVPQVDLDASRRFERTPAGLGAAKLDTLRRSQRAFGEVDEKGGYVGDITNPFSARNGRNNSFRESLGAYYEDVVKGNVMGAMGKWLDAPR